MNLAPDFVLNALLQHNFLPIQNKYGDEMPPILSSRTFSKFAADALRHQQYPRPKDFRGYDAIEYKLTRFNGIPRVFSIPHPTAYAELAFCIYENWTRLDHIASNQNSLLRPRKHRDGRLFVMGYEQRRASTKRSLNSLLGKRFLGGTDISNFFPSIYSHAIPWALVGQSTAKQNKGPNRWFNKLDKAVRWTKRNETQGISIGPAASNILAEVILERIDRTLRRNFEYSRFNDDYTAYCETEDEAVSFVSQLRKELAKYKLTLNINKTTYSRLPRALEEDWVSDLTIALPRGDRVSSYDAIHYLNFAVKLAKQSPDGSVLKYALRALLRRNLDSGAKIDVLRYALHLSFHQPVLLPVLRNSFPSSRVRHPDFPYLRELQMLAYEHSRFDRSDAVSWALYFSNKCQVPIEDRCAEQIVEYRDCIPLLLLYLSGVPRHQAKVISFAQGLNQNDLYELDQYWLLLYQLFLDNKIAKTYPSADRTFEIMKAEGVTFVTP